MVAALLVGLILAVAVLCVIEGLMVYSHSRLFDRLWQHVEDLRTDNKALMESLCRAEGKPFISESRTTIPSEGWWDAKPEVIIKDKI